MGAIAGLTLTAPLLALAALLILLEDGRPVIFVQERAGRGGRPFTIFKLRTLQRNDRRAETMGRVTPDHPMATRVGRWLRRFKVDELPQLVNVLRGEMSLVGPRPTLPSQVEEYGPVERTRLERRPGLTGWAQVNGNIQVDWETRIALDVWYVHHWSLGLELAILVRTVGVVLGGGRINEAAVQEARRHMRALQAADGPRSSA